MNWLVLLIGLLSTFNSPLQDYRWKNRIVLFTGDPGKIDRQVNIFLNEKEALEDRQLLLFRLDDHWLTTAKGLEMKISSHAVVQFYNLDLASAQIILIGKDGFEKGRWDNEVSPQALFALIDRMPMRRQEMKEKSPH